MDEQQLRMPRDPIKEISLLAGLLELEILERDETPIGVAADRSEATSPCGSDVSPTVRPFCRAGRDLSIAIG